MYSYGKEDCYNASKIHKEIISLPLHPFLTDNDIIHISKTIKKVVKKWS